MKKETIERTVIDKLQAISEFIRPRKWVLVGIPVFFILVFLISLPHQHKGTIKNAQFTYVGQILKDQPSGQGELTYANGDSYKGGFKDGKFDSSKGTFVSKTGKWTYVGSFKNGAAEGKGQMKSSDGKTHDVNMKNGVVVK